MSSHNAILFYYVPASLTFRSCRMPTSFQMQTCAVLSVGKGVCPDLRRPSPFYSDLGLNVPSSKEFFPGHQILNRLPYPTPRGELTIMWPCFTALSPVIRCLCSATRREPLGGRILALLSLLLSASTLSRSWNIMYIHNKSGWINTCQHAERISKKVSIEEGHGPLWSYFCIWKETLSI